MQTVVSSVNNMAVQVAASNSFLQFSISFLVVFAVSSVGNVSAGLEEFSVADLQQRILNSRKSPVCVIFKHSGTKLSLEGNVLQLWNKKSVPHKFFTWRIGEFLVDKYPNAPVLLPPRSPCLRCFLGQYQAEDFEGKPSNKGLLTWLTKLVALHDDHLPEANPELVANSVSHHQMVLLGFAGPHKHHDLEAQLIKVQRLWAPQIKVLFIHPHNPSIRELAEKFGFQKYPTLLFLTRDARDQSTSVVKRLAGVDVTPEQILVYLAARNIPAIKITQENFQSEVLTESKYYRPLVLVIYSWWCPRVLAYLSAFKRALEELRDVAPSIRFGMMELNQETQHIIGRHLDPVLLSKFPATLLFKVKIHMTAVVGIDQVLMEDDRPTPHTIHQLLVNSGVLRVDISGQALDLHPWGFSSPTQSCNVLEGPHGMWCPLVSHNGTDNNPAPRLVLKRIKAKAAVKNETNGKTKSWHEQYDSDSVEAKLVHVGLLPLVTDATWQEVIETSHAPSHPLVGGATWRGEVTKVALVVFIMADCSSCRRNMNLFEKLYKSVKYIDGGSLYVVNCTSDPGICRRYHVTGFPTLSAFRGHGWIDMDQCISLQSQKQETLVRLDYHGVLLEDPIMEWFGKASGPAVNNLRFEQLDPVAMVTQDTDVHLVATLMPKSSRYLPFVGRHDNDYFYPFMCFRLACERLYGSAGCYVEYSPNLPPAEFDEEDENMVVSKVSLYRRDGLEARIMRLGEPLADTLDKESGNAIHEFHAPHKYKLCGRQMCEDDHTACTDLLVDFTRDHSRLPVSHLTSAAFHTHNSLLLKIDLPLLIALCHHDNATETSSFYKGLRDIGLALYNQVSVVTVDVDQFPAWVGQFVPLGYHVQAAGEKGDLDLYRYPRLVVVRWSDHRHAAFYPPLDRYAAATGASSLDSDPLSDFRQDDVMEFVRQYLKDPESVLVATEHF